MKVLLNYWQPKDIPEVLEEFDNITGIDKLVFQYFKYPDPHKLLQKFIDEKHGYDWIIGVRNDVIVKQENIDMILKDIKSRKYQVISGVMNVDLESNAAYWNICLETPYVYNPEKEKPRPIFKYLKKHSVKGIIETKYNGYALTAVHKSVFEKFRWYEPEGLNVATDRRFCKWCEENNVKMWTNTDNEMIHLRHQGEFRFDKDPGVYWFKG